MYVIELLAGVIGAGSRIGMRINGRVCTNTALAGDKFTATVTSATMGSNGATIPAGSTVVLEVASVDRADPAENSRIEFRVRAIDVNGSARPTDGEVETLASLEAAQASGGNEKTTVIGGAVAGAVLGRIFGRSTKSTVIGAAAGAAAGTAAARASRSSFACLPEGSALRLTLSRPRADSQSSTWSVHPQSSRGGPTPIIGRPSFCTGARDEPAVGGAADGWSLGTGARARRSPRRPAAPGTADRPPEGSPDLRGGT